MKNSLFSNIALGLIIVSITACSDDIREMQYEYNLKCFGDNSASCRHMLLDLSEAKVRLVHEQIVDKLDKVDAPDEEYEKLEKALELELEQLEGFRPGWFDTLLNVPVQYEGNARMK